MNRPQLPATGSPRQPVRVLMVCLGNICRSPTAEAVLAHMARARGLHDCVTVDSAGTGDWHVGEPPDARAQAHAAKRGYDLSALRGRQLAREDFDRFDWIFVMDSRNESAVRALCPAPQAPKIRRLAEFCAHHDVVEVPDPYAGGSEDFEYVLDLVEDACTQLLDAIEHGRCSPATR